MAVELQKPAFHSFALSLMADCLVIMDSSRNEINLEERRPMPNLSGRKSFAAGAECVHIVNFHNYVAGRR